jgi:hypothetical protein
MDIKSFKAFDWGTGKFDLRSHKEPMRMMLPIEIHATTNGSIKDEPAFIIIMTDRVVSVYGAISLEMLNDGLADIGYKVIKL